MSIGEQINCAECNMKVMKLEKAKMARCIETTILLIIDGHDDVSLIEDLKRYRERRMELKKNIHDEKCRIIDLFMEESERPRVVRKRSFWTKVMDSFSWTS